MTINDLHSTNWVWHWNAHFADFSHGEIVRFYQRPLKIILLKKRDLIVTLTSALENKNLDNNIHFSDYLK